MRTTISLHTALGLALGITAIAVAAKLLDVHSKQSAYLTSEELEMLCPETRDKRKIILSFPDAFNPEKLINVTAENISYIAKSRLRPGLSIIHFKSGMESKMVLVGETKENIEKQLELVRGDYNGQDRQSN